jgi:hypothetical protein
MGDELLEEEQRAVTTADVRPSSPEVIGGGSGGP